MFWSDLSSLLSNTKHFYVHLRKSDLYHQMPATKHLYRNVTSIIIIFN